MVSILDTLSEIDDGTLMLLFAKGDQSAARSLTIRHASRVLTLAHRLLRDRTEAEDITQEVMMKLWKIAPDWQPEKAQVSTWLHKVTRNLCIDRLRKTARFSDEEPVDQVDDSPNMDTKLISEDHKNLLMTALDKLPERQRIAVILRHLEEKSNPEIADSLGVSIEAAESLISRGKRNLKAILSHYKNEVLS